MSKPQPPASRPDASRASSSPTSAAPATEVVPGTVRVDPTQIERELTDAQREIAELRAQLRETEELALRQIERLTRELADAQREIAAARTEASPRTTHGDAPLHLRALSGCAFTLGGVRRRLRAGEILEADPAELEDDGLVMGTHFEIAR